MGERIKELRKARGFSQETLAEALGISRQAVTKWETGQSVPSSENLLALAQVLGVEAKELLDPERKGPNPILRTNLTRIAIIAHAAFLYSFAQSAWQYFESDLPAPKGLLAFHLVLLLSSSIWMASNHRFEEDVKKRLRNTRIELGYCLVQLALGFATWKLGLGLVGGLAIITVALIYILYINPRYMGRKLTK